MVIRPSAFATKLRTLQAGRSSAGRVWRYLPYDQLNVAFFEGHHPEQTGLIFIENVSKAGRRPYHKQKLAWVLCNQRCFALECAAQGYYVLYLSGEGSYSKILRDGLEELGTATVCKPAEYELRQDLKELLGEGCLSEVAHPGWLTSEQLFDELGEPPWRMDAFYRKVRRATNILMDGDKPLGGKWSFDSENRLPWKGEPAAPKALRFVVDDIKAEVGTIIERHFASHPGQLNLETVASYASEVEASWCWAIDHCLPNFGPYEDAMSTLSSTLFHTKISPLLNLHRLMPARVVVEVAALVQLPLASKEGFIRQILGWREFVRHVHRRTDGFRTGGGVPNFLNATNPLPKAFWGKESGLTCLDTVVNEVWRDGYSHHITRLMVLSNLATLLDCNPRELCDWFWVAYIDAFDWVVEPNVLGMGTFATGPLMTTKPYVSGSAYIDKMSDYCKNCRFDPKKTCPITRWYWAFLERNYEALHDNPRMGVVMASVRKRAQDAKALDRRYFEIAVQTLSEGSRLEPTLFEQ